ncbi:MAG: hypothetical protein PHW62_01045 [Candidatus Ratteibacteria bacterium]|nr:hypothetical protein [Candidatus Ratteibacteria bacterium]
MKIKKIIYFTHFSFDERDYERLGLEIMENNGFDVEVWDFTPFLYPGVYQKLNTADSVDNKKYNCTLFLKCTDALSKIKYLESDILVISLINFDYNTYPIFKELSKTNIPYALLISNVIPSYKNVNNYPIFNKEKILNLIKIIRNLSFKKLKRRIFRLIPFKWFYIDFPVFILAGGAQSLVDSSQPIGRKTSIIWGHTLDYDLYLKDLSEPSENELKGVKYAVFIDGYWPFTQDYIYMGVKNPTTPERYYPSLCRFFSRVEKETGFKVVIAAHPRSMYEKYQDYFEGRLLIRGKTKELIRDSEFVLMHYSTSISFAVLYNKPVLFFVTEDLEQNRIELKFIRAYTSALNKRYINIDENYIIDWGKELAIDREAYVNYKERYIKRRGTEEKPFWQIVADGIKKL